MGGHRAASAAGVAGEAQGRRPSGDLGHSPCSEDRVPLARCAGCLWSSDHPSQMLHPLVPSGDLATYVRGRASRRAGAGARGTLSYTIQVKAHWSARNTKGEPGRKRSGSRAVTRAARSIHWPMRHRPTGRLCPDTWTFKRFGKNVNRRGIPTRHGLCSSCSGRMDHVSTFAECTPDTVPAVYRRGPERPCRSHALEGVSCNRRTVGTVDPDTRSRSSRASGAPSWARQARAIPGVSRNWSPRILTSRSSNCATPWRWRKVWKFTIPPLPRCCHGSASPIKKIAGGQRTGPRKGKAGPARLVDAPLACNAASAGTACVY